MLRDIRQNRKVNRAVAEEGEVCLGMLQAQFQQNRVDVVTYPGSLADQGCGIHTDVA